MGVTGALLPIAWHLDYYRPNEYPSVFIILRLRIQINQIHSQTLRKVATAKPPKQQGSFHQNMLPLTYLGLSS